MYHYENKETGEHQVYGPPGTGKTTYMSRQIKLAAQKHGSDNVLVASFTKAAAVELAGRELPLQPEQVATLHAHAYRAIGKPKIVETDKELISQWNQKHPQFSIGKQDFDVDSPNDDGALAGGGEGDELLARFQLMRAKRDHSWSSPVIQEFARLWEQFKKDTGTVDFTDMIALALERIPYAPGNPTVMFIDEAQDMTPLEWELVRKWGMHAEHLIVGGDDDQCIYGFKGASASTFFEADVPDTNKHILSQSYRVPQQVQNVADRWVHLLTKRQKKVYKPRVDESGQPVAGEVRWLGDGAYNAPAALLRDAEGYLRQGKSVMFLTSCAYMLNDLKQALRSAGLPFHNPFRKKRGDWNPLGAGKGVAALLSYLAPMLRGWRVTDDLESWQRMADAHLWTKEELDTWLAVMSVSNFLKRGAGKQLAEAEQSPTGTEFTHLLNESSQLVQMANGHLGWFMDNVAKSNAKKFDYLCTIVERHKVNALKMMPPIVIGTIHSVKGGEADVVYLMPDLSKRGYENWSVPDGRDETIRQFYVGMTRCKETLVVTAPGSDYYIKGLNKFIMEG
jgi:DNA helicase-2/ATP-dependent DNA helicase PcrA